MSTARKRSPAKPSGRGGDRVLTDARAIRALAHPARLAVLDALSGGRELTATACAEVAGLSPSAMSYHLRALQKWGFVERADSESDGRERPWRLIEGGWRIDSLAEPAARPAVRAIVSNSIGRLGADVDRWFEREAGEPRPWRDAGAVENSITWMTAAEAKELGRRYGELIDKLRGRSAADHPEGARRVRATRVLVPLDDD